MSILSKLALSGVILSMTTMASAASISGSTDFRVTLPEILVLYHWDDAHLTLDDVATTIDNNSDAREISDAGSHDFDGDLDNSTITSTGPNVNTDSILTNNKVSVILENSWAVRSLSSGNVTLDLETQQPTLKNITDNSSTIDVKNALLSLNNNDAISQSISSGWEPVMGDIKFDLDLSSATKSGEYNTRGTTGAAKTAEEDTDTFLLKLSGN